MVGDGSNVLGTCIILRSAVHRFLFGKGGALRASLLGSCGPLTEHMDHTVNIKRKRRRDRSRMRRTVPVLCYEMPRAAATKHI